MAKVSSYLERQHEPVSRSEVERNIVGQGIYVRQAIDELVAGGYADESPGARGARNVTFVKPYPTPSDPVATPSRQGDHRDPVSPSVPYKGDGDGDGVADEVERLLAKYGRDGVA